MDVYKRTARQANRFARAYPTELPARIEWWGSQLGIEKSRLLRLVGMPGDRATRSQSTDLKELLKDPELARNASLVEGILARLLSLYGYDPQVLARLLRQSVPSSGGDVSPDELVRRTLEGGPDAGSYLFGYLAWASNGTGETGPVEIRG